MQNNYNRGNRGGGGKKDFKADPIKQHLTVRGTSCAYAKDLCIAGKIKLEDIQEWVDRFTVLQYGRLAVDPKVDAEVMRIGTRLIQKVNERKGTFDEFEKQNPACEDEMSPNEPEPTDEQAEAEIERQRQEYEQAQEEEAHLENTIHDHEQEGEPKGYYWNQDTGMFHCEGCPKSYKTEAGAKKHVAEKHTTGGDYGEQK